MLTGRCLCGSVTFETESQPKGASVCHCGQCRRQSGHLWASAYVPKTELTVTGKVRWFEASETAKRGFCPTCGSFLFWHAPSEDTVSFALGAVDAPTGIHLEKHIFVASKGDYYDITDSLEQRD